jgi:thiol-disulfide isomerase/thioredoxin
VKYIKTTLLLFAILVVIGTACSSSDNENAAYDFTLKDTEGIGHSLSDYKGSKVYLKIWATWCPSCLEGLDELDELAEKAPEKDIVVLTMVAPEFSGEKSSQGFINWYEKQNVDAMVLLDGGGVVFMEYEINIAPTSFFIDEKGEIYRKVQGDIGNSQIYSIFEEMD